MPGKSGARFYEDRKHHIKKALRQIIPGIFLVLVPPLVFPIIIGHTLKMSSLFPREAGQVLMGLALPFSIGVYLLFSGLLTPRIYISDMYVKDPRLFGIGEIPFEDIEFAGFVYGDGGFTSVELHLVKGTKSRNRHLVLGSFTEGDYEQMRDIFIKSRVEVKIV